MLSLEIKGLKEVVEDLDSGIYTEIFTRVVNDVVPTIAIETMRAVKDEWNLGTKRLKLDDGRYAKPQTWHFARKYDRKSNKRAGMVRFTPAVPTGANKTAYLKVESSSLPLSLFETNPDYSDSALKRKNRKPIRYKLKKRTKTLSNGSTMNPYSNLLDKKGRGVKNVRGYYIRVKMKSGHAGIFFREDGTRHLMEMHTITPTTMFDRAGLDKIASNVWDRRALSRYEHYLSRRQFRGKR